MSLRPGKLSPDALAALLGAIERRDPRVIVGPGIGRDAAVLELGGGRALVATSDPVTFAGDEVGWYAVHVNANDIACTGARPAWFLATVLVPAGSDAALPAEILAQMQRACRALDVELVGGHTEVTDAVSRPVVAGSMLGEASREELVIGEGVAPGDLVVLVGAAAVEGTALLAREAAKTLRARGVGQETIDRARDLLYEPGISVVAAVRALSAVVRPRLMHDPTEGGIATALHEMAQAAGARLRVDMDAVPVHEETRSICRALGLDPFGLLASGALLAVVPPDAAEAVARTAGMRVIGRVERGATGVIMGGEGPTAALPAPDRDEIARFFDDMAGADETRDPEGP